MNELASLAAQTAIKTGGGVLGNMFNQAFAKRNSDLQVKATKDLANFENRMQLRNLALETPIKMQSYRNAGLSTAALAGQFGGNLSVPNPSASMPQTPGGGMQLDLDYLGMLQQKANVDLTAANERNVEADTEYKQSLAHGQRIDNYLKETYGDELNTWTIANMKASEKETLGNVAYLAEKLETQKETTKKERSITELNNKQKDMLEKYYDLDLRKTDPYVLYLLANAHSSEADVPLKGSQTEVNEATRDRIRTLTPREAKLLDENIKIAQREFKLKGEQILNLAEQRALIRNLSNESAQRAAMAKFDNQVRRLLGEEWVANREKSRLLNERLQAIGSIMHFGASGSYGISNSTSESTSHIIK